MRLIFLGSPEPVLAPLKTLLEEGPRHGHTVVGVVSQPARPVGRGRAPVDPPVAAFARRLGLPVLQPEKAADPAFLAAFAALAPDVAVTAAYGQILTPAFLQIPRRATINIHPSLLPRYRGATPVPAALLAGDTESGVTVLFTVQRLDAGNIITQERLLIDEHETAGELTSRFFTSGGRLTLAALEKLKDPAYCGTPQDETQVSLCRKIQKTDGLIDWHKPALATVCRFRAFAPWPGSFTFLGDRRLALTALQTAPAGTPAAAPGVVTYDRKRQTLLVGTSDGVIAVERLKPAGGKEVDAAAFWNGLKDKNAVVFANAASAP